jgi:hypothetical protein
MPAARAAAGQNQDFLLSARGNDLLENRQQRRAPAINDALPAELDHVQVGQRAKDLRCLRAGKQGLVHQRFRHQRRLDVQPAGSVSN